MHQDATASALQCNFNGFVAEAAGGLDFQENLVLELELWFEDIGGLGLEF